jgi:hypothetical protein
MKFGKFLENVLLSFCIPGILLISRKKVSGYFICALFIITIASPMDLDLDSLIAEKQRL